MEGAELVDQETEAAIEKLVMVAKAVPMINRMWLFGSRLKGSATECSDLDLAVEVEWVPRMMFGVCDDSFSLWCAVLPYFEKQMKDVSPWPLDLQNLVDESVTPHVFAYVREDSQLVYEKA